MASTFRALRVWQDGMDLTVQVYKSTAIFPRAETYGLAQQINARRFRFRVTSRKEKDIGQTKSLYTFYCTQEVLFGSSRHRFFCQSS